MIRRKNRTKCKLQLCCMDQKGSLFQRFLVLNWAAIKGNPACFGACLHRNELLNTKMWPPSCRLWWSYPWVLVLEKACRQFWMCLPLSWGICLCPNQYFDNTRVKKKKKKQKSILHIKVRCMCKWVQWCLEDSPVTLDCQVAIIPK